MDGNFDKTSRMIPVGRRSDGSCTAASSVASRERLEELSAFVQHKLASLGREILDGQIQAKPYRRKQESACDYCAFRDLCGFDPRMPGTAYRELSPLTREEVWEKLESEERPRREG